MGHGVGTTDFFLTLKARALAHGDLHEGRRGLSRRGEYFSRNEGGLGGEVVISSGAERKWQSAREMYLQRN